MVVNDYCIRGPKCLSSTRGVNARVRDGAEEEMLSRPALEPGVRKKLAGLLDIHLVCLDDGTYLDVLRWESREAADAATELFAEAPEAGAIHDFLQEGLAHHRRRGRGGLMGRRVRWGSRPGPTGACAAGGVSERLSTSSTTTASGAAPCNGDPELYQMLVLESFQSGLSGLRSCARARASEAPSRLGHREIAAFGSARSSGSSRTPGSCATGADRGRDRERRRDAGLARARRDPRTLLWTFAPERDGAAPPASSHEVPTSTPESKAMAKEAEGRGFRFVADHRLRVMHGRPEWSTTTSGMRLRGLPGVRARGSGRVSTESEAVSAPCRAGREGRIGFGVIAVLAYYSMDLTGSSRRRPPCSAPGIAGATLAPSALSPIFIIFHDPQR